MCFCRRQPLDGISSWIQEQGDLCFSPVPLGATVWILSFQQNDCTLVLRILEVLRLIRHKSQRSFKFSINPLLDSQAIALRLNNRLRDSTLVCEVLICMVGGVYIRILILSSFVRTQIHCRSWKLMYGTFKARYSKMPWDTSQPFQSTTERVNI